MPISKEDFINQLVQDGQVAINNFAIHLQMDTSAVEIVGKKLSGNYTVWYSSVFRATMDCSLLSFCRLLDQEHSSLVKIPKKLDIQIPEEFASDVEHLIEWHKVNTLLWRNKILAHSDPRKTQKQWSSQADVKAEEYKARLMLVTYLINQLSQENQTSAELMIERNMDRLHSNTHDVMASIFSSSIKNS